MDRLKNLTSSESQQPMYDQRRPSDKQSRRDTMYDSPNIQQKGNMYDQQKNDKFDQLKDDRYNRDGSSNMQSRGNRYNQDIPYDNMQTENGRSTRPPTDEERERLRRRGLEVVEKVIVQGKVDGVSGDNLKNLNVQGQQQKNAKFASLTVYETIAKRNLQNQEFMNSSNMNPSVQPPSGIPPAYNNQPQNPYARPGINQGPMNPPLYK